MGLFDFLTLGIFAGLIVLFLQRSVEPGGHQDHLWQYLVAACGCAVTNYLGTHDQTLLAILVLVATLVFIVIVLRPLPQFTRR